MSATSTAAPLHERLTASPRAVVTGVFFAFALGLGLWAGAIPVLMQQTGLDTAGLGRVLTLHTAAYITAMLVGGRLLRVLEVRRLMRLTLVLHALTFCLLFTAPSVAVLTAGLIALGVTAGTIDLAMNTDATTLEREAGRPLLIRMHAAASGAFAIGAISGSVVANQIGTTACAVLAVLSIQPVVWALKQLPPRVSPARPDASPAATAVAALPVSPPGRFGLPVVLLGIVLGVTIAAEITAQMWSAQFLALQTHPHPALAGAGAALFSGCQALMRGMGDTLRRRFDDYPVITVSMALAAVGFAVVAVAGSFTLSVLGFALVGAGTACVVPCCFALVAQQAPQRSADALGVASLVAGALRLPTPLCLGFVAATWSDSVAFAGIAGMLMAGVGLVVWMGRRSQAMALT